MDFWKSLSGQLQIRLTSATPERVMLVLNAEGVVLHTIRKQDDLTVLFRISRKQLGKVQKICRRMDSQVCVLGRSGVYWILAELPRRPVLVIGILAFILTTLVLPNRILFIQVQGNEAVPQRQILEVAESCGIRFGASREWVRSEKVKNVLLWKLPQLQWAGVNTKGCVATISVRERAAEREEEPARGVSSLAASRDGYILEATATRGTLLVQPGDSVKSGQILISGYTDCGIVLRAESAEGEIFAQTERKISVITPGERMELRENGDRKKIFSLLIGKKRINLWKDSGISVGSCGRMYKEYYITLPGGFQLPIALCVDTLYGYDTSVCSVPEEALSADLADAARGYLAEQMIGGEILRENMALYRSDGTVLFTGNYICRELISRVRTEQIGEANGENS